MNYYAFGSRILMLGKKGKDVELLQQILPKLPGFAQEGWKTHGTFDENLRRAVCALQHFFQAEEDGVVGKDTYRLLGIEVDEYWPSSLPPLGMRTLRRGMQGRDVLILQNRLAAFRRDYAQMMDHDPRGSFQKGTQKALCAFQKEQRLKATGVLDGTSCLRLYHCTGCGNRKLQHGKMGHDRGYDVFCLQKRLKEKGYCKALPDGVFSLETEAAVKSLQADHQIFPDGIVRSSTYFVLGK